MIPKDQLDTLIRSIPGAGISEQPDGSAIVTVPLKLPAGWNKDETLAKFLIPPAYPAAAPDCFFADPDLRLANGGMPGNSGIQPLSGINHMWFSWHLTGWHPGRNSLLSYVRFIERRLQNAN